MEKVLPETLQKGKKLYAVGTEILLRSVPQDLLLPSPPGCALSYLICQQRSFLQQPPAGSLYLILEAEQGGRDGTGPRADTHHWPHPTLLSSPAHPEAVSLLPFGDGDVTYCAPGVLGEDEAVDMGHSHSIEHRAPTWTEGTSNQGPEVELKEGQVVFRRLCIALQGHRQL